MQQVLDWIKARLSEGTTWAGLGVGFLAVASALDSKASLSAAVVAGLVAIVKKEMGSA